MKISLRISLLAGIAAALTLPVAAQDVAVQVALIRWFGNTKSYPARRR